MGPENSFRVTIAADAAVSLDDAADSMDVAFTIVPPITAPVTLIQTRDGAEVARWDLKVVPGGGISTRCRLGMTLALSTCGAAIGDSPHVTRGDWFIELNGNRILEAGVSFRACG